MEKFIAQSHAPRGENSPASFHGNDEREMRSSFHIHVLIQLKALCQRNVV